MAPLTDSPVRPQVGIINEGVEQVAREPGHERLERLEHQLEHQRQQIDIQRQQLAEQQALLQQPTDARPELQLPELEPQPEVTQQMDFIEQPPDGGTAHGTVDRLLGARGLTDYAACLADAGYAGERCVAELQRLEWDGLLALCQEVAVRRPAPLSETEQGPLC